MDTPAFGLGAFYTIAVKIKKAKADKSAFARAATKLQYR
jgi:hypothetical protein